MSLVGTWNLEVSTPFGQHPATLVIEQAGDGRLAGHIDSRLGNSPLKNLNANGDELTATVSAEIQGRSYEADLTGRVSGDRIEGQIKTPIPFAPPAKYTGTRA